MNTVELNGRSWKTGAGSLTGHFRGAFCLKTGLHAQSIIGKCVPSTDSLACLSCNQSHFHIHMKGFAQRLTWTLTRFDFSFDIFSFDIFSFDIFSFDMLCFDSEAQVNSEKLRIVLVHFKWIAVQSLQ